MGVNYSDGNYSLLDIAEKSGINFQVVKEAADALLATDLLRPCLVQFYEGAFDVRTQDFTSSQFIVVFIGATMDTHYQISDRQTDSFGILSAFLRIGQVA